MATNMYHPIGNAELQRLLERLPLLNPVPYQQHRQELRLPIHVYLKGTVA